ncbi:hypothetical protein [Flavobacterium inviolabile]|uniref:hypothetical protein n=1 Tax=Flavobacterium inviolabile TaxID=2748320 RepID=UPI0015AFB91D|nr:hypothetical protein [Flavobacterium inviolabile]
MEMVDEIINDGKVNPGEIAYRNFRPGNLPSNVKKTGLKEAFERLKRRKMER